MNGERSDYLSHVNGTLELALCAKYWTANVKRTTKPGGTRRSLSMSYHLGVEIELGCVGARALLTDADMASERRSRTKDSIEN